MEVIAAPDRVEVVLFSSYGKIEQLVRVILLVRRIEAELTGLQIFFSHAHETVPQAFKVFVRKVLTLQSS